MENKPVKAVAVDIEKFQVSERLHDSLRKKMVATMRMTQKKTTRRRLQGQGGRKMAREE